jgi:hypothetical protein
MATAMASHITQKFDIGATARTAHATTTAASTGRSAGRRSILTSGIVARV